jgi:hypothetical protein
MFMNVLELLVDFIDFLKIIAPNYYAVFINLARQIPLHKQISENRSRKPTFLSPSFPILNQSFSFDDH